MVLGEVDDLLRSSSRDISVLPSKSMVLPSKKVIEAEAPTSVLILSSASRVMPSCPLFQLLVPGFSTRTLPPTIDKTVKGVKAATFVAHEDIPKIKENKAGTKKIILYNKERVESIVVLPPPPDQHYNHWVA
jgi:hypothetical protein